MALVLTYAGGRDRVDAVNTSPLRRNNKNATTTVLQRVYSSGDHHARDARYCNMCAKLQCGRNVPMLAITKPADCGTPS
jgi:hypothetical protein